MTILGSTISNNSAVGTGHSDDGQGGGISLAFGTLNVIQSVVSGNTASNACGIVCGRVGVFSSKSVVIGMSAGGAVWLRSAAQEQDE